ERPKSKKTKEEKEREKLEKLREREILRVEREEQKLEKERIRIEKERMKALEREAKIEKMKGRLSQPDMEAKLKNPVLGPLTEYKVTADFARKLHEWEVMKGKDISTAMYLEAQKRSLQFTQEYQNAYQILNNTPEVAHDRPITTDTDDGQMRKTSSESEDMFLMDEPDGGLPRDRRKPPPLTLIPCGESPEHSPGAPVSDDSSMDDRSTETMESMTQHNIISLEKANKQLLEELRRREIEYNSLQDEVRILNDQLINFRNEHVLELDMYKKQLVDTHGVGDLSFDTRHMTQTLEHLEDKIGEIKKFGEQLAMSMEGAAVGKFQTVEGEESINTRLVDLLDKMRLLLGQATLTGGNTLVSTYLPPWNNGLKKTNLKEVSKKSSALHHFEKLYSQAMQLQMQMNNLRLSQLERNKEIMNMKRHLLLQKCAPLQDVKEQGDHKEAPPATGMYGYSVHEKCAPLQDVKEQGDHEEAPPSTGMYGYSVHEKCAPLQDVKEQGDHKEAPPAIGMYGYSVHEKCAPLQDVKEQGDHEEAPPATGMYGYSVHEKCAPLQDVKEQGDHEEAPPATGMYGYSVHEKCAPLQDVKEQGDHEEAPPAPGMYGYSVHEKCAPLQDVKEQGDHEEAPPATGMYEYSVHEKCAPLQDEANNLLLQADVTRREAELLYYKEYSQKRVPIKRWN
ncbi:hypothetical protein MAR_030207, partial [Mya arenaria]